MIKSEEEIEALHNEKSFFSLISSICTFSLVWSFGACLDTVSRKPFDISIKRIITGEILMSNKKRKVGYPDKGTLFDYNFRVDSGKGTFEWIKWVDLIEEKKKIRKD